MSGAALNTATIQAALSCIPSDLPRDEWLKIGMALKSELSGEEGFSLFDAWSSTAANYKPAAIIRTWKSFKPSGGVGIGTLLLLAKQHGFKATDYAPYEAPSPAARAAQQAEQKRLAAIDAKQKAATQEATAKAAALEWGEGLVSAPVMVSSYLHRKGLQSYGIRFRKTGEVLIPVRDATGKIWNIQTVAAVKPASGIDKLFMKGGRKAGLWHWCGEPPTLSDANAPAPAVVLLCEGYATGASLHEATGYLCAVAFDAGNLPAVAKAIRALYPRAKLVMCADNDLDTAQRTGKNAGIAAATIAAQAVGGCVAVPPSQASDGEAAPLCNVDFNDLHHSTPDAAVGLTVIREIVAQAIDESACNNTAPPSLSMPYDHENPPLESYTDGYTPSRDGDAVDYAIHHSGDVNDTPTSAPPSEASAPKAYDPFTVNERGVWFEPLDNEGNPSKGLWVCSRLTVDAETCNLWDSDCGYLLEFKDSRNNHKKWAMPARMLATDGAEMRGVLLGMGLKINMNAKARTALIQYIQTRPLHALARCTERLGWHKNAYVLPTRTLGTFNSNNDTERLIFQSETALDNTFKMRGDVAKWRDTVGTLCVGNSRLLFAVSTAFAGALLELTGVESGGFNLRGTTSSGKSTALRAAVSVWGGESHKGTWRATDNALESIAAQHCDNTLFLDELGESENKTIGSSTYMLANGKGKARATRNGAGRPVLSWRLLLLSSGELSLTQHAEAAGIKVKSGQELRLLDIPVDAGKGMGVFEDLHGQASAAEFSLHFKSQTDNAHGASGYAWLEWLTDNVDTVRSESRGALKAIASSCTPAHAGGEVSRVINRFAVVAYAGELATQAGLTGWAQGTATTAAKQCLNAWLAIRQGGVGSSEDAKMLAQVRHFLETNGTGKFTLWHRAHDSHAPDKGLTCGFRRWIDGDGKPIKSPAQANETFSGAVQAVDGEVIETEYFIFKESFEKEVCKGFDPLAVKKVLAGQGGLKLGGTKDKPRYDHSTDVPMLGRRVGFWITPSLFDDKA
jgi:putative DNA primase/helicase